MNVLVYECYYGYGFDLFLPFFVCHFIVIIYYQGRIQDFKLGKAHLKKLRRAEGDPKNLGVFRVKNHDFTPKKSDFFQMQKEARTFLGYFV